MTSIDDSFFEKDLLKKISEDDEQAFRILIDKYSPALFAYMLKLTSNETLAEELVQDIFIKIWLTRESLLHIRSIKAYLFILSRNQAINAVKQQIRNKAKEKNWRDLESGEVTPDSEEEWHLNLIDEAIESLPIQQKSVWVMSRREGIKTAEIAERMNLTHSTVKKYLRLAVLSIMRYVRKRLTILFFLV